MEWWYCQIERVPSQPALQNNGAGVFMSFAITTLSQGGGLCP